jgi:hypothetical protein
MFARAFGIYVLAMCVALAWAQDVSPGVHYKKATPEINAAFLRKLEILCRRSADDKEVVKLFANVVVSGPTLYGVLKRQIPDAAQSGKRTYFMVPIKGQEPQKLEGRSYGTADDIFDFEVTLHAFCTIKPMKLRKPNRAEIDYYWALIPYDIEEPIYVAENDHLAVLIHGDKDGKIFFVDLLPKSTRAEKKE